MDGGLSLRPATSGIVPLIRTHAPETEPGEVDRVMAGTPGPASAQLMVGDEVPDAALRRGHRDPYGFTIITAWYARRTFLKQSQEARAIEQLPETASAIQNNYRPS